MPLRRHLSPPAVELLEQGLQQCGERGIQPGQRGPGRTDEFSCRTAGRCQPKMSTCQRQRRVRSGALKLLGHAFGKVRRLRGILERPTRRLQAQGVGQMAFAFFRIIPIPLTAARKFAMRYLMMLT